jgi:four helix bundle protein
METRNPLRDLVAWQKAVALHADLIRLTLQPAVARHAWLSEQLREGGRRLAGGVAEGQDHVKDINNDLLLASAKGDALALLTLLEAARQAGLLEATAAEALGKRCEELHRLLGGLLRRRRDGPVSGGSQGPWRRRPPSDGGFPEGDPWDSRS